MATTTRRATSHLALAAAGLLAGLALAELTLALADPDWLAAGPREADAHPYHVYSESGLGKCYPSDPRDYFPFDLGAHFAEFGPRIDDVSHLSAELTLAEKVEHLRRYAPHCAHIELQPLNGGPRPELSRRVLVVGDSFAFGEGLSLEDTIGYRLAAHVPDVNFPNMAWPGASIDTLPDLANFGDVEAILYFYNVNDVARTEALHQRGMALHEPEARAAALASHRAERAPLCDRSRLCRWLQSQRFRRRQSAASVEYYRDLYLSPANAAPRRASLDRFADLARAARKRGARLIVAIFPLFYKEPVAAYPLADVHALVAAEARRHGIEVIDLLPAYERYLLWNRFLVHPQDRHPSAEAIEVAARYLAAALDLPPPDG